MLVLIGISVAAVVPQFNGTLGQWQLRETALNLRTSLQLASQWACVRQEAVALALDVQRGTFALKPLEEGRLANRTLPGIARQSFGRSVAVLRMDGVRDVGGEKALLFWPDGTSDAATIVLTGGRVDSAQKMLWEVALDSRGTVHCQERRADETSK